MPRTINLQIGTINPTIKNVNINDAVGLKDDVADPFIYGTTEPFNTDPTNPLPQFNVGWDGAVTGTLTGDQTVASGATLKDKIINGYVTLTDATSTIENCIIYGRNFNSGFKPAMLTAAAGGTIRRCTFWGTSTTVAYYTNAITQTGGTLTVDRCVLYRVNDCIKVSSGGSTLLVAKGNLFGKYAFFDTDLDHPPPSSPPYWTHNDAIQVTGVSTLQHQIIGNKFLNYAEAAGVVWDGGVWGSGAASGGDIGAPATALNAGYRRNAYGDEIEPGQCTWANGITFSNNPGHKTLIDRNWIDGVNASSGLIQFTSDTGNTNVFTITGNRFGLGGKPSGSGKYFLVSYLSGNTVTQSGNIFDDNLSVPVALRGTPLTFTATGSSIIP